ncbi:MAG: YciI family protein [Dongiaceae bacterium]
MRFMMQVRANAKSESGVMPSKELIAAMGKYNEEMIKAGVMLAGDGLQPSAKGARISFAGGKPKVTQGPFPDPKELISGFWMIQVKSKEEAIDWATRVPFKDGEVIELRQVFETADFPAEILPPEEAAREDAQREILQKKAGKP